jgi:hypothetical protein
VKRAVSLLVCGAAVVAFSFVLASYGEPVNAALWRDFLWRL